MMRSLWSSTVALCLFAAGSALAVAPQRTFVASHGHDTDPCSLSFPCRGFQAAIDAVVAGGEVVVLDSAGYGTMEIHKSVSVIVPPGIHAGLSPTTGIPLPGYPGQYGVVLIDIQDTDVVVLRGLNLNRQGTVTGGIEWISTHGGTVQIENAVINGFPMEGVYMQAPNGTLFLRDSTLRNNGTALFVGIAGGWLSQNGVFADGVRFERSDIGVRLLSGIGARLARSTIDSNDTAVKIDSASAVSKLWLNECVISGNGALFSLSGTVIGETIVQVGASSILHKGAQVTRTGNVTTMSFGNNSADYVETTSPLFDYTGGPR